MNVQITLKVPQPGDKLPFIVFGDPEGMHWRYDEGGMFAEYDGDTHLCNIPAIAKMLTIPIAVNVGLSVGEWIQ